MVPTLIASPSRDLDEEGMVEGLLQAGSSSWVRSQQLSNQLPGAGREVTGHGIAALSNALVHLLFVCDLKRGAAGQGSVPRKERQSVRKLLYFIGILILFWLLLCEILCVEPCGFPPSSLC